MIAIGMSLREARERRGLALAEVERETRIRARHLDALERERFERLPERAYARAFLAEYAAFLGLEEEPFVEEFDARFPAEPAPPFVVVAPTRRRLALIVLAVAGAVALVGWLVTRSGREEPIPAAVPPPAARQPVKSIVRTAPPRRPARTPALVLVAHGRCWVEAHAGGTRAGKRLFYSTLEPGDRLRLVGRRFWLRLGAPGNLEARLGGRPLELPQRLGNVVVTAGPPRVTVAP